MDIEELERRLRSSSQIRAAADSAEARGLLQSMDTAGIEQAAKRGDTAALRQYLTQVLTTPEGRAFAERIRKAVDGNG